LTLALLIFNGALIAAMYAVAREAALEGVSPLGLLYWQTVSSAIIVSAIAGLRGEWPRFSLRYLRHYAVAALLGASVPLLASGMAAWGLVLCVVVVILASLLLVAARRYRTHEWPAGLSPLGAASGMLIVQALLLDPAAAYAHAIVLPGTALTRLDWLLLAASALSSAFYVSALASTAGTSYRRLFDGSRNLSINN
jgi:hypothetical protein